MAEVGGALQYVTAAVAVAKFLVSQNLKATVSDIRKYFEARGELPPEGLADPDAVEFVALLTINRDLLSDLEAAANEGVTRYRDCLKKASKRQERDACDRRAERDICETLNRIKERNQGHLPTKHLRDQWSSFGCVEV